MNIYTNIISCISTLNHWYSNLGKNKSHFREKYNFFSKSPCIHWVNALATNVYIIMNWIVQSRVSFVTWLWLSMRVPWCSPSSWYSYADLNFWTRSTISMLPNSKKKKNASWRGCLQDPEQYSLFLDVYFLDVHFI